MKKLSAIICLVFCFCANLLAQSLPSVVDRNNHELKGKVKQLTIREYRAFINGDQLEKQDLVYTTIFHFYEDGKYQEIEYIDTDSQTKSVYLYSDSITLIKWFDGNNEIRTDTIIYTNFGKKIKEVYADGSFEMVKKTYKYNDQNQLVEVRHTFAEPEHKQIFKTVRSLASWRTKSRLKRWSRKKPVFCPSSQSIRNLESFSSTKSSHFPPMR